MGSVWHTVPAALNPVHAPCLATAAASYSITSFAAHTHTLTPPKQDGRTALQHASDNGHMEVVNVLLGRGAALEAEAKVGVHVAHCAYVRNHAHGPQATSLHDAHQLKAQPTLPRGSRGVLPTPLPCPVTQVRRIMERVGMTMMHVCTCMRVGEREGGGVGTCSRTSSLPRDADTAIESPTQASPTLAALPFCSFLAVVQHTWSCRGSCRLHWLWTASPTRSELCVPIRPFALAFVLFPPATPANATRRA